jgi:hypothetical protein
MGGGDYEPEESEAKLALAERAAIMLQRYGDVFVPLENSYIDSSFRQFGDQAYDSAMGRATTRAAGIYEDAERDLYASNFQAGLDPTSGRFQGDSQALMAAKARGVGEAGANAGINNTDAAYANIANIVRMGQGLASDSTTGAIDVANNAFDASRTQALDQFSNISGLRNIAGTMTGGLAGFGYNAANQGGRYG